MVVKEFDNFVNEMYMLPADGAKAFADHKKKQLALGYYPDAVSAEAGGPGNGGGSGAPSVGENDTPSMLSTRLGDIEPDGYPSASGQSFAYTQQGTGVVSTNNMRGEPTLTNLPGKKNGYA